MKLKKPPAHPSGVTPPKISKDKLPKHVAVVMDGNGRWAKNRGLPRTEGHRAGEAREPPGDDRLHRLGLCELPQDGSECMAEAAGEGTDGQIHPRVTLCG